MEKFSYPRNGKYELFIYGGNVKCFDDPHFVQFRESDEMHKWINQQPKELWYSMDPPLNTVYYLQPELYLWFKLSWMPNGSTEAVI